MTDWINWILSNQLLVAGIGTVVSSALMYAIRSVPSKTVSMTSELLTSMLSVNSRNDFYSHIDAYLSDHVLPWTFRRYEPADRADDDNTTYLNTGYGSGYGIWRGVPFRFVKTLEKQQYSFEKTLTVRFLTRQKGTVESFVNEAVDFRRGEPRQRVYTSMGHYWERMADKRLRSVKTVFANDGIIETIVERVDTFMKSENWYLQRGIPYKLVVLLHGAPGTGKTSLIHAVASNFGLDIDYVTSLGQLGRLLSNKSSRRSIVVIEDIDTLARLERDARANANKEAARPPTGTADASPGTLAADPVPTTPAYHPPAKSLDEVFNDDRVLHDTLNSFDGFTTQHGVIIFMTSNHPETLDPAMLRPGRVDLEVPINALKWNAARRMFAAFFGQSNLDKWDALADVFEPTTGAQLQSHFMKSSAHEAIDSLSKYWSERKSVVTPLKKATR